MATQSKACGPDDGHRKPTLLRDGKIENGRLIAKLELDLRDIVGVFALASAEKAEKVGNKEDYTLVYEWIFTPNGENLQMEFQMIDRRQG